MMMAQGICEEMELCQEHPAIPPKNNRPTLVFIVLCESPGMTVVLFKAPLAFRTA